MHDINDTGPLTHVFKQSTTLSFYASILSAVDLVFVCFNTLRSGSRPRVKICKSSNDISWDSILYSRSALGTLEAEATRGLARQFFYSSGAVTCHLKGKWALSLHQLRELKSGECGTSVMHMLLNRTQQNVSRFKYLESWGGKKNYIHKSISSRLDPRMLSNIQSRVFHLLVVCLHASVLE